MSSHVFINNLLRVAEKDPEVARDVIEQSILAVNENGQVRRTLLFFGSLDALGLMSNDNRQLYISKLLGFNHKTAFDAKNYLQLSLSPENAQTWKSLFTETEISNETMVSLIKETEISVKNHLGGRPVGVEDLLKNSVLVFDGQRVNLSPSLSKPNIQKP